MKTWNQTHGLWMDVRMALTLLFLTRWGFSVGIGEATCCFHPTGCIAHFPVFGHGFFVTFRVLVHLESSLHRKHSLSSILCFLGCCPPGWDAKGIWKGGLKTKNSWDWMATRIASETENNGLWTVHSTPHRCVWLKRTDSVNAFEVWFDSCLKFCFCQKNYKQNLFMHTLRWFAAQVTRYT